MGARWQCPSSADPGAEPGHDPCRGMKAAPDRCGVAVSPSTGCPRHRQQLCPQAVARFLVAGRTGEISSGSQAESGGTALLECQGRRGQMVRVHQGTERSVGLSPHAAGRDLLSARGQLPGSGRRWDRGRATRHSHRHLRPALWHPALLRPAGAFLGRRGLGIRFSVWITEPALPGAPSWH